MSETVSELMNEADEQVFRQQCRDFLDDHATGVSIEGDDPRGSKVLIEDKKFLAKLSEAGLAGLTYASEYGGQGLTKAHDKIWREEYSNYPDMTNSFVISHGMCTPMMSEYGTHEQKAEFLPDMISGKTVWCQMFSEPGAGSDVASLQMKADLDGDEWTLNGQKVWTTLAHVSDYGLVIARTDVEQPKHGGISMFIVKMDAPGIEIRPITQINGGTHFNEVFFSDARFPKDALVGPMNEGWRLATAMLMYERVAIGTGSANGIKTPNYKYLAKRARANGRSADPVVRQQLMRLYSEEATKSLVSMQTRAALQSGKTPGPGGSLSKLHGAMIAAMSRSIIPSVAGNAVAAWEVGSDDKTYSHSVLSSFMANIAGGTDEIQKNIIGDRVLGLPREPSVDKGVAFRDLRTGTQA